MTEIKLNYQFEHNKPVSRKGGWYDIPLPHDIVFKTGDIVKITFDLRLDMPDGYEAILVPRSSTLEKTGLLASGFGVIEDSYRGPDDFIGYRFYATRNGAVYNGTCLVQMRFQEKMKDYKLKRVNNENFDNNVNRGGFGSTDAEKNVHINQLNWEPKEEYQEWFSDGFDEGYNYGYEEGFKAGYDKGANDAKSDLNLEYAIGFREGLKESINRVKDALCDVQKVLREDD